MVIVEGEGAVLAVNVGHPIVTNGDFVAYLCESDVLFPNYFGEDLLSWRRYSRSVSWVISGVSVCVYVRA